MSDSYRGASGSENEQLVSRLPVVADEAVGLAHVAGQAGPDAAAGKAQKRIGADAGEVAHPLRSGSAPRRGSGPLAATGDAPKPPARARSTSAENSARACRAFCTHSPCWPKQRGVRSKVGLQEVERDSPGHFRSGSRPNSLSCRHRTINTGVNSGARPYRGTMDVLKRVLSGPPFPTTHGKAMRQRSRPCTTTSCSGTRLRSNSTDVTTPAK